VREHFELLYEIVAALRTRSAMQTRNVRACGNVYRSAGADDASRVPYT